MVVGIVYEWNSKMHSILVMDWEQYFKLFWDTHTATANLNLLVFLVIWRFLLIACRDRRYLNGKGYNWQS